MRRLIAAFLITSTFSFGIVGCSDDDKTTTDNTSTPSGVNIGDVNNHGTKSYSSSDTRIEVELNDSYFQPTFLEIPKGQKVTLDLKNEGAMNHTFTSTALGVDEKVAPGETKMIEITAPESGFSEFHCTPHQSFGMKGAVVVR